MQKIIEEYDALSNNHYLSDLLSKYNLDSNLDNFEIEEFLQKLLKLKTQCVEQLNRVNNQLLVSKTVLITGGASGIGKAMVDVYLKAGAKVIIFDIKNPNNDGVEYHNVDVRDRNQIAKALSTIPGLDILITCAGVFDFDENMDEAARQRMVDININGVENSCELCMPLLQQSQGQICTITSGLAKTIDPTSLLYCITKQEIIKLTEKYASQYNQTGIRTNSVLPGPILTPLLVNALPTIEDLIAYSNLNPKNMIGIPQWVALEVLRVTCNNQFNNYQSTNVDCGETSMANIEDNKYWTPNYTGDYSFTIGGKLYTWDNPYSLSFRP